MCVSIAVCVCVCVRDGVCVSISGCVYVLSFAQDKSYLVQRVINFGFSLHVCFGQIFHSTNVINNIPHIVIVPKIASL